jgi:SPP1 gp7 family putative phage head morphogenesis protein
VTKTLSPIHVRKAYHKPMADAAIRQLYDIIFKPIFDILNMKHHKVNSLADVKQALRAGRIYWENGYFYGQFGSVVGRTLRSLGAEFVRSKRAYKLDIGDIPMDLRTDIAIGKGMNRAKTEAILGHLEDISQAKIILGSGQEAVAVMDDLNIQTIKTFKVLPESMQLPMDMTDRQRESIKESYTENMDLYINGWKDEAIERLRVKVQENAAIGYRADRLASIVKNEFGVTESKAKFIARQEASLLVSKYREERYTNVGVKEYIWSTSNDERVRHDPRGGDHRGLNGRRFSWDSPPVVDHATGRKANPGEDFNCRCLALPIINLRG